MTKIQAWANKTLMEQVQKNLTKCLLKNNLTPEQKKMLQGARRKAVELEVELGELELILPSQDS